MPDEVLQLEELIRRTGTGDAAAFAQLYDRTAPKLFGIALRIIGQREIAEDALQECFLAVWRRASVYDAGRGEVMTWLATICRRCAIDRLRRLGARPDARPAAEHLLDELVGPDRADRGAELRALQRCLDELGDQPRRAVLLAYLYGLTREELAARLAVPVGTVKSWVRRALDRLRRCLDG